MKPANTKRTQTRINIATSLNKERKITEKVKTAFILPTVFSLSMQGLTIFMFLSSGHCKFAAKKSFSTQLG